MSSPEVEAAVASETPAVRLVDVTKRFGPIVANRRVNLTVQARSVHAIVGENGAGKSTLMKTLAGVHRADEGEIWLWGERILRHDPNVAIRHGLGMVHQHFMLVEPLTVAENLVLGREPTRRGLLDVGAAVRAVEELGAAYGLSVDPHRPVEDLSVGERQRVEILKVLYRGVRILVLDEPTAVLTPGEVDGLFGMLRTFVDDGKTVILITHKLDEVMDISQRVTVIRRGEAVGEVTTADTSPRELAHWMVGREVVLPGADSRREGAAAGENTEVEPALELHRVTVAGAGAGPGRPAVDGVSLRVQPGEIVGIAGVQGNGQSELLECISGLRPLVSGGIRVRGQFVVGLTPRQRTEVGLAHIPEDRHRRGLVLDFSLAENLILGRHRRFGSPIALAQGAIAARASTLIERFDVRPPVPEAAAGTLSGGNQQKVVVAREITDGPVALLAGQPTRGVDIGAVEAIHDQLRAARDGGLGVLLVSADLNELLALSDRIAVMHRGRIVAVFAAANATIEKLGEAMLGAGGTA